MTIQITDATKQQYVGNLSRLVDAQHDPYQACPKWGNYVGNGANDAWNKADAALKTWPALSPAYAPSGSFPHTAKGALAASRALRTVQAAEAAAGRAGAGDPLHVGFGGDPEQEAAFDHDFEHGVAAMAHDLRGELAANAKFAARSETNARAAAAANDLGRARDDRAAAVFIRVGESGLDRTVAAGRDAGAGLVSVGKQLDTERAALRDQALRALESLKPH